MDALHLAAEAVTSPGVIWRAALIAWILAVPLWFLTKFVVVLAHEGGHAIVGIALLNRVRRIDFNSGGGGGTEWVKAPMWPFVILILLAGYAGPSLFGLMAAWLLRHDRPDMVIWGSMAFLVLMLFAVRGWIGWVVIPLLLVVLYQVATKAEAGVLTLIAYVWTWFLLIGAVQRMLVYIRAKHYQNKTSDTALLQRVTWLPNEVWTFVQLIGTGAALVWGGAMLLRLAG
jgi:hypothetical protein